MRPSAKASSSVADTLPAAAAEAHGASSLPVVDPAAVLEEAILDGLGRFRLFGDGRVSVLFADGAVLTMRRAPDGRTAAAPEQRAAPHLDDLPSLEREPSWMLCELLRPDGRTCTVRSSCPVGAEGYVGLARQFHRWASASPERRVDEAERRALEAEHVQTELRRVERHLRASPHLVAAAVANPATAPPPHAALDAAAELGKLARLLGDAKTGGDPALPATHEDTSLTTPTTPKGRRSKVAVPPPSPPAAPPLGMAALNEVNRIERFLSVSRD